MATIDTKRNRMIHVYGTERLEIERETIRRYENGDEVVRPTKVGVVNRKLSALSARPVPGAPVQVATYSDLLALLGACADALANEEEARVVAEEAALEAAKRAVIVDMPVVDGPGAGMGGGR